MGEKRIGEQPIGEQTVVKQRKGELKNYRKTGHLKKRQVNNKNWHRLIKTMIRFLDKDRISKIRIENLR